MVAFVACALGSAVGVLRWLRSGPGIIPFLALRFVHLYARLWHGWSCNGPPALPSAGPAILVANHTCSADPALLTAGCFRVPSFLIAGEFFEVPLLRALFHAIHCVPVRRDGRDATGMRTALRRLNEGRLLVIFPEGGLSNAGRQRTGRAKPGVALLALRSQAPVFPALITGGPQTDDILRSWLRPSRARVIFGPPVDLSAYHGRPINRKLLEDVTQVLMDTITALKDKPGTTGVRDPARVQNNGRAGTPAVGLAQLGILHKVNCPT